MIIQIYKPDLAGNLPASFSVISRYDRATTIGCVVTTTRLSASEFSQAPGWTDYGKEVDDGENNRISPDHACKFATTFC